MSEDHWWLLLWQKRRDRVCASPSSALPPSTLEPPDSSSWQQRNLLAYSSAPVLEDHAGCGEVLPEGAAARGVQPHPRFHQPHLEAFRFGFPASGVISSSTNHFVIHMQLLGSGFGMKEHSTSLLNLELYS